MAGDGHYKVISVDYRMPPEAYFPAAVDDAVTVYKAVLKDTPAKNIGVFGTSAGGALTLELVLRAREQGLPAPGALGSGTPMSDATKTGDSFYTNEKVDNILVSRDGFCDAATVIYAHGHDLKDPLISPVYGDMHGFPPTILTTGTRDLLLSNTVRVHRKLRRAGIEATLQVYEGVRTRNTSSTTRCRRARKRSARLRRSSGRISESSRALRSNGVVIARSEAMRRSRGRRALYVPLDCFASLAIALLVPPERNLSCRPARRRAGRGGRGA